MQLSVPRVQYSAHHLLNTQWSVAADNSLRVNRKDLRQRQQCTPATTLHTNQSQCHRDSYGTVTLAWLQRPYVNTSTTILPTPTAAVPQYITQHTLQPQHCTPTKAV